MESRISENQQVFRSELVLVPVEVYLSSKIYAFEKDRQISPSEKDHLYQLLFMFRHLSPTFYPIPYLS